MAKNKEKKERVSRQKENIEISANIVKKQYTKMTKLLRSKQGELSEADKKKVLGYLENLLTDFVKNVNEETREETTFSL
jgi:hypothetical protein